MHCCYIFIAGPPYEPTEFEVVMETSISVTVHWKAGFAAGYEPQTFRLEYKETTESGKNGLFTARNEVGARLCFYRRLSFC